MYVVVVEFEIAPDHIDAFREAMLTQADNSLRVEPDCHQFDVCWDADRRERCFLYEKYSDRAAFDVHLASPHFQKFDATVKPWLTNKQVSTWQEAVRTDDSS